MPRVSFSVTSNPRLHKMKGGLHACGYVGNPHSIYRVLIACLLHDVVQYSITPYFCAFIG